MMTLRQLAAEPPSIPTRTSWYLADLAEARGKQELFTRQSPQKLKVLREHALVESAISSNRIEGVEVDKSRVGTLIFGKPVLRDRDEEEVRGYRNALELIHERGATLPISEATIKRLHKLCRSNIWDAGHYKEKGDRRVSTFRIADLQAECPGVGVDLIRQLLARLQKEKKVKSLGTGRGAKWQKLRN
jgi:Fic family protein